MVGKREFVSHLFGVIVVLAVMTLCLVGFGIAYLPTFPTRSFAEQITIVTALIESLAFYFAIWALMIASIKYERPR